jgi:hypothetical protein
MTHCHAPVLYLLNRSDINDWAACVKTFAVKPAFVSPIVGSYNHLYE